MSSARKMMERALQINGLGLTTFMAAQGFDPERETDQYKPYSAPVRARIAEAILEEIAETNRLAQPYVLSHVGRIPLRLMARFGVGVPLLKTPAGSLRTNSIASLWVSSRPIVKMLMKRLSLQLSKVPNCRSLISIKNGVFSIRLTAGC